MKENTKPDTTRRSNPVRWQRLKRVLAEVLDTSSPEERTAALEHSCGGDTALLREAEKLLARDTSVFEEFADVATIRLRCDEHDRIGERMGAYAVVQELGRGGMGAVYLAERADGQFKKRVAIKVLKRGTDTDEVLRRFRIERQILANLEHPNITRLLDAGTTADGLPYFVMEFVEGTPITKFVRREKIDLRGRLKLFLKVCSAVDLAHRHQIIHRDIKPGNVLVNEGGEPKLLDFGIAKLLSTESGDENTTVAGERRLTPKYAAPEQNEGQSATIATDVYSLGVLLCELLTDHSPSVSSDGDQLPNQLDQIVARALQHDPAQRYASVAALSNDVERYLSGGAPPSEHFSTASADGKSAGAQLNARSKSRRHWYIAGAGLSTIVLATILFFSMRTKLSWLNTARPSTTPAGVNSTRLAGVRSIAVLPFEPLGRDMNDELLGLGMADAVISRMSNLKQLAVLPTSAVAKYKGPANDPFTAGRTLGVDAILSGTIQRSGDRVRVTVQLVHVASGRSVWSEKFDQTFTDIFGVQDAISDNVARSLALNLTSDEQKQLAKRYTTNASAYDEYLMGLYFWNKRSRDDLEKAIDHFGRAVEKDPNFALAYALMSDCYYLQVNYRYDSRPAVIQKAKATAERALLLDESLAEAHVAIAMVQLYMKDGEPVESDRQAGMDSLRRAIALNPNLAIAHQRYAWVLAAFGSLEDSLREMRRAEELDPLSHVNNIGLGSSLLFARQYSEGLEYCYKAAEIAPNQTTVQNWLAFAYFLNGMYQQAIERYLKVRELSPAENGNVLASIAAALAASGRKPEADSLMPEILKLAGEGKVDPYHLVALYAIRNEKDAAFEWFAKALEKGAETRSYGSDSREIRYDPLLDPLRSDSRFAALLRQYNRDSLLETAGR